MQQEREKDQAKHKEDYNKKVNEIQARLKAIDEIKKDFYALFNESNAQLKGKKLEAVLNSIFAIYGVSIKEAFIRKGEHGEGIIEQIDGVIEIDNQYYLVEIKWKKETIGIEDIYAHLGRVYHRANAHGIYISASGYTDASKIAAKEALQKSAILILTDLKEFIDILEQEKDLVQYFRAKIRKAIIDKEPYSIP